MIDRFNKVILPMLLGLLGAYSHLLRVMRAAIASRTFEPGLTVQDLVSLSMGALAGVVAGWLLSPQQLGLSSSVPVYVLAFLAGYGTEALFGLLERLTGSFGSVAKPAST